MYSVGKVAMQQGSETVGKCGSETRKKQGSEELIQETGRAGSTCKKRRQGSKNQGREEQRERESQRKGRKTNGRVDEQICISYEINKQKYCLDKGST